jgi:hypothetical protein
MYKYWTDEETTFLRENYPKHGKDYCAKKLNKSNKSVLLKACRLKIKYDYIYQQKIDMGLLQSFIFSYILGLLWSDGHLAKNRNSVILNCALDDGKKFFHIFQEIGEWNFGVATRKGKQYANITVNDKAFHDFLEDHDYHVKSLVAPIKVINALGDDLIPYFIRGIFDGDGCFYLGKKQKHVTIAASVNYPWDTIKAILYDQGINSHIEKQQKQGKGNWWSSRLQLCSILDILRFYNFVYSGDQFGLPRKKEKFNLFIEKLKIKLNGYKHISPYKGKRKTKYYPKIKQNGKTYNFGVCDTIEEAQDVIKMKHKEMQTEYYLIMNELGKLEN